MFLQRYVTMIRKQKTWLFFGIILLLTACIGGGVKPTDTTGATDTSVIAPYAMTDSALATKADSVLLSMSPRQVDSLVFRLTHHYSENFNFRVKADSLQIVPREGDILTDTCTIYEDDVIAVAAIRTVPGDGTDTVWVKVAHDQFTMGWIEEGELLRGVVPDDPISSMLDWLTSTRGIWMSVAVIMGLAALLYRRGRRKNLQLLKFEEMDSPYPMLFLGVIALMASLYASVQNFVPEFWQEYYFHPTLNPLELPLLMAVLVTLMWLTLIMLIAVIDEVMHYFPSIQAMVYLFEIIGAGMVVYLIVSWTTLIYIGYPLLVVLIAYGFRVYNRYIKQQN